MSGLPVFFPGQAPVFALPNVVLFPGARLALHVFESRYREMTRRALASDRLIAIALLRPGWEADYEGNPPIHATATLGQIIMETELPDGCFNIVLEGLVRFRPGATVQEIPYRIMQGVILEDGGEESGPTPVRELARTLGDQAQRLGGADFRFAAALSTLRIASLAPGRLADAISGILPLSVEARQSLLDTADVQARLEALVAAVGSRLAKLDPGRDRAEGWKWN
ncbi:MAG: LON peptidase substrate-binding domain-containing protein [Candidatus Brocadiae bacterium]|nr:LON peptidase substrate-binding domain-containing protein [Candidatus Brocadiia bacterium]